MEKPTAAALKVAIQKNRNDTAKEILSSIGIDTILPSDDTTGLSYACAYNNFEIAEFCVDNGADVNKAEENGITPLLIACEIAAFPIIKLLVQNGADVNKKNNRNIMPLHWACFQNVNDESKEEIITYLIENGADPNVEYYGGSTFLNYLQQDFPNEASIIEKAYKKS